MQLGVEVGCVAQGQGAMGVCVCVEGMGGLTFSGSRVEWPLKQHIHCTYPVYVTRKNLHIFFFLSGVWRREQRGAAHTTPDGAPHLLCT